MQAFCYEVLAHLCMAFKAYSCVQLEFADCHCNTLPSSASQQKCQGMTFDQYGHVHLANMPMLHQALFLGSFADWLKQEKYLQGC